MTDDEAKLREVGRRLAAEAPNARVILFRLASARLGDGAYWGRS